MDEIDRFMNGVKRRSPGQPEFYQAVEEVARSVLPYLKKLQDPRFKKVSILERMTEPDRIIIFRVCWEDDNKNVRANRGFRVQFNNAIGPYKGGLRFDKSVNLGVLKFLGFEQTFKNALTTLPMGGAKGGSNFNPIGKSDSEVMRFCQSYMTELHRHIGDDVDIPAGDLGCGAREVSYLFGQYKRLTNKFQGTITGKGLSFGGSEIRTEATGWGSVYFAREMLRTQDDGLEGKICVVSGSGNVALYTVEKLIELGAKVVTISDRNGYIYDKEGINEERLNFLMDLKLNKRGSIEEYAEEFNAEFHAAQRPWKVPCDLAFPSATQNELDEESAKLLVRNGCRLVSEGANMPTTLKGIKVFREAGVLFGPAKAANAGGVAISGLEITQNVMRLSWTRENIDNKLQEIMGKIHAQCVRYGETESGYIDYVNGANIAGFRKVAEAMLAYGIV
ncbi:MAG: NADP-specific glutamate dehydrogenase [Candidatus Omnitrophica bacterium]|nr:NADP-specific glutamate dehydrogenase [Candidatus Omnitrophota bacterium]